MGAQSKPFYPTRWYYELIYPFGPLVLRSLTRRRRAGRSGEVLRRDYVRDLDLLDGMAGAGTDLRADHPTVFDFAVWGLLRTMEGLRGEELLASRIHLAAWYAAMAR
jgi:glutathione S-transferase